MDNGYFANWVARVEYEANERIRTRQDRLWNDIQHDEFVDGRDGLRDVAPKKQSEWTSPKVALRWQMIRMRGLLARLL